MSVNDADAGELEAHPDEVNAEDSPAQAARLLALVTSVNAVLRDELPLTAELAMQIVDLDVLLGATPTLVKSAITLTETVSRIPNGLVVGDRVRSLAFTVGLSSPRSTEVEGELQVVELILPAGVPSISLEVNGKTSVVLGRGIEWEVVRIESRDGQTRVTATVVDVTAAPVDLVEAASFTDTAPAVQRFPSVLERACEALVANDTSTLHARTMFWTFAASRVTLPSPTPVFDGDMPKGRVQLSIADSPLTSAPYVAVFTHPDELAAFRSEMFPASADGLVVLKSIPDGHGVILNPGSAESSIMLRAAAVQAFLKDFEAS